VPIERLVGGMSQATGRVLLVHSARSYQLPMASGGAQGIKAQLRATAMAWQGQACQADRELSQYVMGWWASPPPGHADYELRTARSKCTVIWVHICRFGVIMGGSDLVLRSAPALALGADQVPDMSSGCHVGAAHGRIASHSFVAPNSLQRGRPRF
jgi:hypothetical protein